MIKSENAKPKKLVLFDIDGTLLRTNGAGMLAIKQAMLQVFGDFGTIDRYIGGGKNYQQIVLDTLQHTSIPQERILEVFPEFTIVVEKNLQSLINKRPGRVFPLPGGIELVERLSKRSDLVLGLVTGNPKESARIKLMAAGYKFENFLFNSFGDEASHRAIQVYKARQLAFQYTGYQFEGAHTIIVGDTIHDIYCARETSSMSLIVSTGDSTLEDLQIAKPDYLVNSLQNTAEIEHIILC